MPNRIIKESICESKGLADCSLFANDLYKRLITYADDYGRFNSDTTIIRARLFPRDYEYVTEDDIVNGLIELAGVGKISFYTTQHFNQGVGHTGVYGAFPNWNSHQRLRDSKAKCPDPGDTNINDWYLRRFIPLDMKADIVERDNFKCQICGKFLTSCRDAKRFVKLGQGLFHIDHIVPVKQGGRATNENLRLTCPECNLKRKKKFSFQEILDFNESAANCGELPQVAANCGELPPESNPIQSESNSYPNQNPNLCTEPDESASVPQNVVITLTLNDKTEYPIFQKQVDEWQNLYPAVDVIQQLRAMKGWLDSNPLKRKTKNGIKRFINGWLSREQDKGGVKNPQNAPKSNSSNPFLAMLREEESHDPF